MASVRGKKKKEALEEERRSRARLATARGGVLGRKLGNGPGAGVRFSRWVKFRAIAIIYNHGRPP